MESPMPNSLSRTIRILLLVIGVSVTFSSSAMAQQKPLPAAQQPVKPEKNPPGDIPDDQVFIDYASPLGFSVKVPEGWARQDLPNGVSFADKYGRISMSQTAAPKMLSIEEAKQTLVSGLEMSSRAVTVAAVKRSSCPPDRRSASPMVRIPIQTLSPTRRSDWKTIGITSGRTENSCL